MTKSKTVPHPPRPPLPPNPLFAFCDVLLVAAGLNLVNIGQLALLSAKAGEVRVPRRRPQPRSKKYVFGAKIIKNHVFKPWGRQKSCFQALGNSKKQKNEGFLLQPRTATSNVPSPKMPMSARLARLVAVIGRFLFFC